MRALIIMLLLTTSVAYAQVQTETVQKCASSALEAPTTMEVPVDTSTVNATLTTEAGQESLTVPKPEAVPVTPVPTQSNTGKKDD